MYCDKCNKQSPDNFKKCVYCGAELKTEKKKEPSKFVKKQRRTAHLSFKDKIALVVIVATVLVFLAAILGIFTGSKPERVVKNFTKAIETADYELYYSLYDSNIVSYKKENRYFDDETTFKQITSPLGESISFYTEKCGSNIKLSYKITDTDTLDDDQLQEFSDILQTNFGYVEKPSRVDLLNVEIYVKGENGKYKTVYNDFWCMKIKGTWYKVDKNVYNEYVGVA